LNWSRGSSQHRGIGLSPSNKHRFWLTLQPHNPLFHSITTITSRLERRNCNSLVNRCKTFAYINSIQARREAHQAGADDALLLNTQTELCCGTAANLFVRRHGIWLTPPLNSGCLPGVMRARGLSEGIVKESNLGTTLEPDDEPLLINSLNCHPIRMHDKKPTKDFRDAKELWDKLTRRSSWSTRFSQQLRIRLCRDNTWQRLPNARLIIKLRPTRNHPWNPSLIKAGYLSARNQNTIRDL